MKANIPQQKWRCIGESVKGASHVRSGLPNQDAIQWYPDSGIGLPLILAVSDGHGSAKSFRSDIGSRLAVETAINVIREFFLNSQPSDANLSSLKDATERLLPRRIVNEWRKAVNQDLGLPENSDIDKLSLFTKTNLTHEEKKTLVESDGETAWQAVENNYYLAYGATLLAVLVTDLYIVYVQLGDGDILQVDSKGNTTRPLEQDPRLIANETTSLCMDQAWNEFRLHVELYQAGTSKELPNLILTATDGYCNSYSTDAAFFKIGDDYRQMFKSNLIEDIDQQLIGFLRETSEKGSGDDITLGLIKRLEKDDKDYVEVRLETIESKVTSIEESSMTNQKSIDDIETKIKHIGKYQKKISDRVAIEIFGLVITFIIAVIGTAFSSYSFFRLNGLEESLRELKHQGRKGQIRSLSANGTSLPSSADNASLSPTPRSASSN